MNGLTHLIFWPLLLKRSTLYIERFVLLAHAILISNQATLEKKPYHY